MPPPLPRRSLLLGTLAALPGHAQTVRLRTTLGDITIGLHMARAPLSAADFLAYVHAGAYSGGRFFRTVRPGNDHGHPPINVLQGGARPGARAWAAVAHETTARTGLRNIAGSVALTRDAPGTGSGNEFFINVTDNPGLDFGAHRNPDGQGFAVFGQVVAGMDVVRRIWALPAGGHSDDAYTTGQILTDPVVITKAS